MTPVSASLWGLIATLHETDRTLFDETRNVGFVWRAWHRARKSGTPMPPWVLDAIDVWAATVVPVLENGGSAKELAAALGLTTSGGGPGVARQMLTKYER